MPSKPKKQNQARPKKERARAEIWLGERREHEGHWTVCFVADDEIEAGIMLKDKRFWFREYEFRATPYVRRGGK